MRTTHTATLKDKRLIELDADAKSALSSKKNIAIVEYRRNCTVCKDIGELKLNLSRRSNYKADSLADTPNTKFGKSKGSKVGTIVHY